MLSLWSPSLSPRCGSRQGAALAHLDSLPPHDLVLWTDGSVPFRFWQGRLRCTCQLLSLWQWGHSFLFGRPSMLKFFRWSLRHSARSLLVSAAPTSLPFFFSSPVWLSFCPRHPILSSIFPVISNSVADLAGTVLSLLLLYQATRVPGHSFLPGNDAADELARRGALLAPSAIPCSLSPLISRIHSCLFSDWRRTASSKYFDTQVPSISTEGLVLPRHARCVLSRLRCNGHSLLGSYLSRIGRLENSSCSVCGHPSQDISHLILHCPATDSLRRSLFGDSLSLYDLWSRPWGVARLLGSMVFRHAPIPRKGSGNQQQQQHNSTVFQESQHRQICLIFLVKKSPNVRKYLMKTFRFYTENVIS